MVQKWQPFYWRCGFCILDDLHQEGSVHATCAAGLFFLSSAVLSKSWRPLNFNTSWSYTMTKNVEEKILMWTKAMLYYCPKNAFFIIFLDIKHFVTITNEKPHFKWYTLLERYNQDIFLSLLSMKKLKIFSKNTGKIVFRGLVG